jgi:hypothetical protein
MSLQTLLGPKDAKISHAKLRRWSIFLGSKPSKEKEGKDIVGRTDGTIDASVGALGTQRRSRQKEDVTVG